MGDWDNFNNAVLNEVLGYCTDPVRLAELWQTDVLVIMAEHPETVEVMRVLITHGAHLDQSILLEPLLTAITKHNVPGVELLLQHGVVLEDAPRTRETLISFMSSQFCGDDQLKMLQLLLREVKDCILEYGNYMNITNTLFVLELIKAGFDIYDGEINKTIHSYQPPGLNSIYMRTLIVCGNNARARMYRTAYMTCNPLLFTMSTRVDLNEAPVIPFSSVASASGGDTCDKRRRI